jgi:uncharacterized membrane protein YdjX (TVP38/TMEM64 family)
LTFEALAANRAGLGGRVAMSPLAAAAIFVLVYAVATAVAMPGVIVLTLAGGFLLGGFVGGLGSAVGGTLGATILFLAVDTSLGALLRRRAGPRLLRLEGEFRRHAASYLLVLRLIPGLPFFLVNLAAGLLGMPWRSFVIYTFIGMLPSCFIYASLGAGLGGIIDDGQSPGVATLFAPRIVLPLLALAILAAVPALYRRVLPGGPL